MDIQSSYTQGRNEFTAEINFVADSFRLAVRIIRCDIDSAVDEWMYFSRCWDTDRNWVEAPVRFTLAESLVHAYTFFGVTL